MEDNEDEPEDVRRATPVEEEIRKGEIDQESGKPTQSRERRRRHECGKDAVKKKLKEKSEDECCGARRAKASKAPKTATVYIHEKECVLPKIKAIPRHCLTKQEWIDILATPSRKCPSPCLKKPVVRRIRPVSPRMAELAQPPKQRLINTLQSRAGILPTELIDKLIQNLEGETCLTPEQAEKLFRDKEIRSKKKSRKKKKKVKCIRENYDNSEAGVSSSAFDKDAVNCQYLMAESFVRSILDWKCPIPREEFKDIAQVILKRLGFILEYNPVNGEDKKSQQMRFLADLIASWISGVLFEVAEARKTELDEECERRRKAKEEESEEESEEDSDEDFLGKDDDDEDDEKPKKYGGGGGGGGGGGEGGGGEDGGGADGGGKDDQKKKDSTDDDRDEEATGRRPTRKVRESMEKNGIDRTEEDDEKLQDPQTETSQEIGEKKTPLKKPEVPEEAMAPEIRDERADDGKIEDKEAAKPEEKKESEEFPKSGEKSVPEGLVEPATIETERTVDEIGKLPDSPVKDSGSEGPGKDEAPKKSEPREITKGSEQVDDRANRQFEDSKPPEVSAAIAAKDPKDNVQDGPSAKIAGDSGDSSVMAGLREANVNKEEITKIEEAIRKEKADGEKMDAPTSESPEIARGKPEGQLDARVESEEEKRAQQKIIDEGGKRKMAEEGRIVDDPSVKASAITETSQAKEEVTFDPRVEREEEKQIRKTANDEEGTKKTEVGSEGMENSAAEIAATSEQSPPEPEVTLDPRTEREQEEDARKKETDKEDARKKAAGIEKIDDSSTRAAETSQDKPGVKFDLEPELEEEARMRAMMIPEDGRKKTDDEAKMAKDSAAEAAKTSEISQARPELTADSKIDAEEEKKMAKEASIPTSRSPDREKLAEEDEERRRIMESSKEASYPMELGKAGKRKVPGECPSGLTVATKYRNDTPFVTFDKIFHTIYNAIEESEENKGADAITNRLHRVVYEKFSNIVQEEKREPLSELTKDVLEVMSGKIAKWLKNVLSESQINFANKFPATVESTEIREWTKWISCVSDMADDWSKWIQNTIRQAEGLSSRKVTRGDWANWTENIDVDALRWRKFYLESVHRAHQNLTMVRDRQVVKSGTREIHDYHEDKDENEREVKITDLQGEKRNIG